MSHVHGGNKNKKTLHKENSDVHVFLGMGKYRGFMMNGPILSADFWYLRVTIFGTKFQTSVPVY